MHTHTHTHCTLLTCTITQKTHACSNLNINLKRSSKLKFLMLTDTLFHSTVLTTVISKNTPSDTHKQAHTFLTRGKYNATLLVVSTLLVSPPLFFHCCPLTVHPFIPDPVIFQSISKRQEEEEGGVAEKNLPSPLLCNSFISHLLSLLLLDPFFIFTGSTSHIFVMLFSMHTACVHTNTLLEPVSQAYK